MNKNEGYTLIEAIVAIAALLIIIGLLSGLINAITQKSEAESCIATLVALTPDHTLCIQEKEMNDQLCVACTRYNAAITKFNASTKCGQYGPITLYTCPNPPPPPSD